MKTHTNLRLTDAPAQTRDFCFTPETPFADHDSLASYVLSALPSYFRVGRSAEIAGAGLYATINSNTMTVHAWQRDAYGPVHVAVDPRSPELNHERVDVPQQVITAFRDVIASKVALDHPVTALERPQRIAA